MNLIKQVQALTIDNPTPVLGGGQGGLNNLVGIVINIVFALAGLLFLVMIFMSGINYLTAGGDPKNAAAARERLTNAIIGLIIVVAAFAIAQIIFDVLGLESFIEVVPE
jgi:hypothetical protein